MKLIAHRGASGYAPENTLASFKKAIDMGADAVEFDVQMSKDNQLVVIHDYYLDRTTTGKGLIMDSTYSEIKKYDAGSWFDPSFSEEYVPLLEEVLEMFPEHMEIHLEIKKVNLDYRNIEEDAYQMIKKKGLIERTVFSSFDHHCLKRLLIHSDVNVGVLISSSMIHAVEYMEKEGLKSYSLNQNAAFVTPELVKEVHESNLKINSYTVNDKRVADYFRKIGVDGIFTNYLDRV